MGGKGSGGLGAAKPAWLKRAEGNPGKRLIPEPMQAGGRLPDPPRHFTPSQKACWDEICIALPAGVLVRADANVVERCAVAWAIYQECTDLINKTGIMLRAPNGFPVRNPALITRNFAARELSTASMEIGLSPLARSRIGMPVNARDDAMDLLMNGDPSAWTSFAMESDDALEKQ